MTQIPVIPANFDVNRCNDRGEKPDFWPVNINLIPAVCRFAGNNFSNKL